jgi:hypothetical protein
MMQETNKITRETSKTTINKNVGAKYFMLENIMLQYLKDFLMMKLTQCSFQFCGVTQVAKIHEYI